MWLKIPDFRRFFSMLFPNGPQKGPHSHLRDLDFGVTLVLSGHDFFGFECFATISLNSTFS